MIAISFAALIECLNLEGHLATRVELAGAPRAGVERESFLLGGDRDELGR